MRYAWLALRPWRRHSLVLAVAGPVYVIVGLVLLLIPLTPDRAAGLTFALRLTNGSSAVWGVVWVTVGVLALASTRWPPASETWGYTAMTALAALWASVYALGMIFFDAPITGVNGVVVWGLVAFMWWAISGLRNPDDVTRKG